MPQHIEGLVEPLGERRERRPDVVLGGPIASRELARLCGARYAGASAAKAVPALARMAA